MCIAIDQACGFVMLNDFGSFVYCCKSCSNEFTMGRDFEEHFLSEHKQNVDGINLNANIFVDCNSGAVKIEVKKMDLCEQHENENQSLNHHAHKITQNKHDINHSSLNSGSESFNRKSVKVKLKETTVIRRGARLFGRNVEKINSRKTSPKKPRAPSGFIGGKAVYHCDMCPSETFIGKESLKTHMRRSHIRKRCDLCNIIPKNYDKHMRITHMNGNNRTFSLCTLL